MAITIDWPNAVITVNKADMILIQSTPSVIYQLDMDVFRLTLKDLEDDVEGMPWPRTHNHNPPVTVSGAVLARVVEILDPYTVTFEDGQYRVNVVGANTNIGERTNVNQVSVSTSNSAGLQDLNSLQAASYAGMIAVDTGSTYSGTTFPVGTRGFPVNNLGDAHLMADDRGIHTFLLVASMTLDDTTISPDGYEFTSDNPAIVTATVDPAINVTNAQFFNLTVQGTLDGGNLFRDCYIGDINYVNGMIYRCGIQEGATITLGGGAQANILDSFSLAPDSAADDPTVNMGGSGNNLVVRNFSGGLNLTNMTGASDEASLDFLSGRFTIDSSCTAGTIIVRGIVELTDNSGVGCTVIDKTISHDALGLTASESQSLTNLDAGTYGAKELTESTDPTNGVPGFLELWDANLTYIGYKRLWEDAAKTIGYRGKGIGYESELLSGTPTWP